jgi:endonuclease YncB( thermonuclease family)
MNGLPTALCVCAVAAAVGSACAAQERSAGPIVAAAIGGDTVRLLDGRTIRLLGVDAPDGRMCHAYLSRRALARLLPPGTRVTLSPSSRSRAYLFRDGMNVNLELVRIGSASALFRPSPGRFRQPLLAAAHAAKAAHLGAWGGCSATLDPSRPWRLERRQPDRIFR